MGQTLTIWLCRTLAGVFMLPLGFLAARNVVAGRSGDIPGAAGAGTARSVDTLVWALIWINVVGLGPFAGALAIASTDLAALAKLMSEADPRPRTRVRWRRVLAAGGGQPRGLMRFGILPQVLPVFAQFMRCTFSSSNTRSATIIGIVGAGGIGLYLSEMIRVLEWRRRRRS